MLIESRLDRTGHSVPRSSVPGSTLRCSAGAKVGMCNQFFQNLVHYRLELLEHLLFERLQVRARARVKIRVRVKVIVQLLPEACPAQLIAGPLARQPSV